MIHWPAIHCADCDVVLSKNLGWKATAFRIGIRAGDGAKVADKIWDPGRVRAGDVPFCKGCADKRVAVDLAVAA